MLAAGAAYPPFCDKTYDDALMPSCCAACRILDVLALIFMTQDEQHVDVRASSFVSAHVHSNAYALMPCTFERHNGY